MVVCEVIDRLRQIHTPLFKTEVPAEPLGGGQTILERPVKWVQRGEEISLAAEQTADMLDGAPAQTKAPVSGNR